MAPSLCFMADRSCVLAARSEAICASTSTIGERKGLTGPDIHTCNNSHRRLSCPADLRDDGSAVVQKGFSSMLHRRLSAPRGNVNDMPDFSVSKVHMYTAEYIELT